VQPDFNAIVQALRESLASAIAETFRIAFIVTVTALVVSLFMKEVSLRKQ
jgi:hypothetical protein